LIGLCKFLTLPEPNPIIITKIPAIFEILVSFLRYVQYVEQKREVWKKQRALLGFEENIEDEKEAVFGNKDILRNILGNNPDPKLLTVDEEDYDDTESDTEDEDDDDENIQPTDKVRVK